MTCRRVPDVDDQSYFHCQYVAIASATAGDNHQVVINSFANAGCAPPLVNLVTYSFQLRVTMLANGAYRSELPHSVLKMYGDQLPVKPLPVSLWPHVSPTVLVTLKSRTPTPLAALFIKQLKESTRSLDVVPTN